MADNIKKNSLGGLKTRIVAEENISKLQDEIWKTSRK